MLAPTDGLAWRLGRTAHPGAGGPVRVRAGRCSAVRTEIAGRKRGASRRGAGQGRCLEAGWLILGMRWSPYPARSARIVRHFVASSNPLVLGDATGDQF